MTTEIRSLVATQFQLMFNSFIDLSKNHGSLIASSNGYHYVLATVILVAIYMAIVNQLRFRRLNAIKKKHGFSDDPKSYENMTPDQAQEIEKNLAEFEMPWLFEFSWLFDFLRTASTPPLSIIIGVAGHFVNDDPLVAHRRQQDTVCLLNAFMAQPLRSEYSSLALARINVHHSFYSKINSDTVMYVIWHFWRAEVVWINRVGWRKLEPFEVWGLWVFWRELAVRLGVKYVPVSIEEVNEWSKAYRKAQVYPHKWNKTYGDSILSMFTYMAPNILKPLATDCFMALLDEDVIWACQWESYSTIPRSFLRPILLGAMRTLGLFQRWFCLPRSAPYVRTPTAPNPETGLFNFPEYTYETSPYYVRPNLKNQWGPWAILNRIRGIGVPGAKYDSQGIAWESMGAKRATEEKQLQAENKVRQQAKILMEADWGFRASVPFQPRPMVKPLGLGYGSRDNAFPDDVQPYPPPSTKSEYLE